MERKIKLLESMEAAKADAEMYRDLLKSAEQAVKEIKSELDFSFTPGNSRYSSGELLEVKQRILSTLSGLRSWIYPRDLFEAIPEHSSDLIMRELTKMIENKRSNIIWNGRKGPASQYRRLE